MDSSCSGQIGTDLSTGPVGLKNLYTTSMIKIVQRVISPRVTDQMNWDPLHRNSLYQKLNHVVLMKSFISGYFKLLTG